MATTPIAGQKITFKYGEEGKSSLFNALNYKLLPKGVYSDWNFQTEQYSNGALTVKDTTTVTISPGVYYLYDTEYSVGVRVETTENYDVNPTPSAPIIVAKIDWSGSAVRYADFICLPLASLQPDFVIIGEAIFDDLDNIVAIGYNRRDNVEISKLNPKKRPFFVTQQSQNSRNLVVNAGQYVISGHKKIINDTVVGLSTSPLKRWDLLYLNDSPTGVGIISGIDSATPTVPDYGNNLVIAEVLVEGSVVQASNVINIDPGYYLFGDTNDPTFDTITLTGAITQDTQAVTKKYVDDLVQGLDPQESVLGFVDFVTAEPGTRNPGDRYIVTTTGNSSDTTTPVVIHRIYEWDLDPSGTIYEWEEITPTKGAFLLNEADNKQYVFTGTVWTQLASTVNHNDLAGLQGGTVGEMYHLTLNEKNNVFVKNVDTTTNITEGTNLFYTEGRVSANFHVSTAYTHSQVTGNPHGTTPADIPGLTTYIQDDPLVDAAYAHSLVIGNPHNTSKTDIGLGNVDNVKQVPFSYIGQPNGVVPLNALTQIDRSYLTNGTVLYSGTWDPSTELPPTLTPTAGDLYLVTANHTFSFGNASIWNIGDLVFYSGSSWYKINNLDTVVNGQRGVVTLTTSEIPEGSNLYYLDSRVEAQATVARLKEEVHLSAGIVNVPAITNVNDALGQFDLGSFTVNMYHNAIYSGRIFTHTVPANLVIQAVANQYTYLYVEHDGIGGVTYQTTTDNTVVNHSDKIMVLQFYWEVSGIISELHFFPISNYGEGLPNKIAHRLIHTERFGRESGLLLNADTALHFTTTTGTIWYDGNEISLPSVNSSVDATHFYRHVAGVWEVVESNTLNNTQYDNGTDLVTLSNNRYAVNWIYKSSSNDSATFVVLGTGDYNITTALESQPPAVPDIIAKMSILVGRVIYQKNSTTPYRVDSAFSVTFAGAVADTTNADNITTGTLDPNRYEWVSTRTYELDDIVTHNGNIYVSLINTNLSHSPSASIGEWRLINLLQIMDYSRTYTDSEYVVLKTNDVGYCLFKSLQNANTGHSLSDRTWWKLIPGQPWNPTFLYAINDIVQYEGVSYKSLQNSNSNKQPDTFPTWWIDTSIAQAQIQAIKYSLVLG